MKRGGEHFSDEHLSDFVRGVLPPASQAATQAHLDSGCDSCAQTARLFGAVASASLPEVPPELTAAAVAIFELPARNLDWIEKLTPLVPRLVFGPGIDLQLAGIRDGGLTAGRAVYRAGHYSVDLSLETPEAADRREMVGQISDELEPKRTLEGVIVQVITAGKTVSETATNRFGEFVIELPARNRAILRFALRQHGHRIDLPLQMSMTKWRLPR